MVARIIISDSNQNVGNMVRAIEGSGYTVVHKTERSISLSPKRTIGLLQFKQEIKDLVNRLKMEFKIEELTGYVPKAPTSF